MNSYIVAVLTTGVDKFKIRPQSMPNLSEGLKQVFSVKAKDSMDAARLGECVCLDAGFTPVRVLSVCEV